MKNNQQLTILLAMMIMAPIMVNAGQTAFFGPEAAAILIAGNDVGGNVDAPTLTSGQSSNAYRIPNSMLHDFISRIGTQPQQQQDSYLDMYPDYNNYRIRKDLSNSGAGVFDHEQSLSSSSSDDDSILSHYHLQTRDDILLPREPVPRKEFLEHSSLYGHQYMQGGAGEGDQHLKPDGSIANIQVIKSDSVLPAYCNPPNPCPNGYTAEDGCLEEFENSADFSKDYQSSQECMCDSEHMFNCPGNTEENELETLARSIQNEGISLDSTLNHIMETMDNHQQQQQDQQSNNNNDNKNDHKVVAKKYFIKRGKKSTIVKRSIATPKSHKLNPFLVGEKLPVVAKKTPHTAKHHG